MKRVPFLIAIVITFLLEIILCFSFIGKIDDVKQNPVEINECLKSIEKYYGNESKYETNIPFVLLDTNAQVVYKTENGLSETVNDAIKCNDTILDVIVDEKLVGQVIFQNETVTRINDYKMSIVVVFFIISALQLILVVFYFLTLKRRIVRPFERLNSFAVRVAGGNLDMPLDMDRKHIFGNFTEAFDLMRSELKKARAAEKKANDEKKEVIAKLSHDIKTPVASIKSTSEIGFELTKEEKSKEYFNLINVKSDQITTLVDNLFNSSINDVTEISVQPSNYSSSVLKELISNADYLHRVDQIEIPECVVYVDKLRMQQAFDNVFMNSYKYADTPMHIESVCRGDSLVIRIRDEGAGVKDEELPLLKEKYKRGSNISEKDGAGLGLYLTNYFIENMDGKLELHNLHPGFEVAFFIRLI